MSDGGRRPPTGQYLPTRVTYDYVQRSKGCVYHNSPGVVYIIIILCTHAHRQILKIIIRVCGILHVPICGTSQAHEDRLGAAQTQQTLGTVTCRQPDQQRSAMITADQTHRYAVC